MIEIKASTRRTTLMGEITHTVMRWQDDTQAYDNAVGERLGLNAAERRCLGFLHDGPKTAGAIAVATGLTPAAVTSLVDRLERRGLLVRSRDDTDRRKVLVGMTIEAEQVTMRYYGPIAAQGAAFLEGFADSELETIYRFIAGAVDLQQRQLDDLEAEEDGGSGAATA